MIQKFKDWLYRRFLPACAKDSMIRENQALRVENARLRAENDRLNAYLDGLDDGMRLMRLLKRLMLRDEVRK